MVWFSKERRRKEITDCACSDEREGIKKEGRGYQGKANNLFRSASELEARKKREKIGDLENPICIRKIKSF